MKDIVLLSDETKRKEVIQEVDSLEASVFKLLDLIEKQILGEEGLILANETEIYFENWKPIRDRVINLAVNGEVERAASITQGEGAEYVKNLEHHFTMLNRYSRNKADAFIMELKR